MTFGRPVMIADAGRMPLPDVVDDGYVDDEGFRQPTNVTSFMMLFVQSCRLFDILRDVLQVQSAEATTSLQVEDLVVQTLKTNRRLETFFESVPPVLRDHSTTVVERSSSLQL